MGSRRCGKDCWRWVSNSVVKAYTPLPESWPTSTGLRLASLLPGVKWKSPRFFFCIHSSFDLKRNAGGSLTISSCVPLLVSQVTPRGSGRSVCLSRGSPSVCGL